jgi:hypothetical protein
MSTFYEEIPRLVLGFHGCEADVRDDVLLLKKELQPSVNSYDWLGHGIYFWENDPRRAYEWAISRRFEKPAVIGAIIDLGRCLNLCDRTSIEALKAAHADLLTLGIELPMNKGERDGVAFFRYRDCAVIEYLKSLSSYDSAVGVFPDEGRPAYEGAGFKEKSHIQICVTTTKKILGYFLPKGTDWKA